MYNPALGRWMQEDPIDFDGGYHNLYVFVGNAPIATVDPQGLKGHDRGDVSFDASSARTRQVTSNDGRAKGTLTVATPAEYDGLPDGIFISYTGTDARCVYIVQFIQNQVFHTRQGGNSILVGQVFIGAPPVESLVG